MALTKSTDLGNGYSAEYFRITRIILDMEHDDCQIKVDLYKDQASREASLPPVAPYTYHTSLSSIFDKASSTVDNPLHAAYEYLKSLDFYSGAVDS